MILLKHSYESANKLPILRLEKSFPFKAKFFRQDQKVKYDLLLRKISLSFEVKQDKNHPILMESEYFQEYQPSSLLKNLKRMRNIWCLQDTGLE